MQIATPALPSNPDPFFGTPYNVRELGLFVDQLVSEKSYLEAVSFMKRITDTVAEDEDSWLEDRVTLCILHYGTFDDIATALGDSLSASDDVDEVLRIMKIFVKSECDTFTVAGDTDPETQMLGLKSAAVESMQKLGEKLIAISAQQGRYEQQSAS